jgi:hypothetical protein
MTLWEQVVASTARTKPQPHGNAVMSAAVGAHIDDTDGDLLDREGNE